jgi:AraC-like DNA-binding protein
MIYTPDRIAYYGLLGAPTRRLHGAVTVYVAHETPFEIRVGAGERQSAWVAWVPANTAHEILSRDRLISDVLIEPECLRHSSSRQVHCRISDSPGADYSHMRQAFDTWVGGGCSIDPDPQMIDRFFFGRALESPVLDPRIEVAVKSIREKPCEQFFATECARLTGLSYSRFVHLFKEEIGMTFRAFCAWKRARAALPYMTSACNLTDLALQTGYPDSTHFSHSIRRIFGLRPRDILAGSRRIALQHGLGASGPFDPIHVVMPWMAGALPANVSRR